MFLRISLFTILVPIKPFLILNSWFTNERFSSYHLILGLTLKRSPSKLDLKKLVKHNQVIGLHSTTHPVNLPNLLYKDQLKEYKDNMYFIKKFTKSRPISMSHPFGRYNKTTLKILNDIGIKVGFLSYKKNKISSLLEIPRVDHVEFIKILKWK